MADKTNLGEIGGRHPPWPDDIGEVISGFVDAGWSHDDAADMAEAPTDIAALLGLVREAMPVVKQMASGSCHRTGACAYEAKVCSTRGEPCATCRARAWLARIEEGG